MKFIFNHQHAQKKKWQNFTWEASRQKALSPGSRPPPDPSQNPSPGGSLFI